MAVTITTIVIAVVLFWKGFFAIRAKLNDTHLLSLGTAVFCGGSFISYTCQRSVC